MLSRRQVQLNPVYSLDAFIPQVIDGHLDFMHELPRRCVERARGKASQRVGKFPRFVERGHASVDVDHQKFAWAKRRIKSHESNKVFTYLRRRIGEEIAILSETEALLSSLALYDKVVRSYNWIHFLSLVDIRNVAIHVPVVVSNNHNHVDNG